jgi:hypothetical protein
MNTLFKCSRCGSHHERDEDGMIIESTKCAQEQNDEKQEEANRQPCSACHGYGDVREWPSGGWVTCRVCHKTREE